MSTRVGQRIKNRETNRVRSGAVPLSEWKFKPFAMRYPDLVTSISQKLMREL